MGRCCLDADKARANACLHCGGQAQLGAADSLVNQKELMARMEPPQSRLASRQQSLGVMKLARQCRSQIPLPLVQPLPQLVDPLGRPAEKLVPLDEAQPLP